MGFNWRYRIAKKSIHEKTAAYKLAPIVVVMPAAALAFEAFARHLNGQLVPKACASGAGPKFKRAILFCFKKQNVPYFVVWINLSNLDKLFLK